MSDDIIEFKIKDGLQPYNLILTHLLRIEEKQLRTEMLIHQLLRYKMSDTEMLEFLESIDVRAEQLKMELLIQIITKYGS